MLRGECWRWKTPNWPDLGVFLVWISKFKKSTRREKATRREIIIYTLVYINKVYKWFLTFFNCLPPRKEFSKFDSCPFAKFFVHKAFLLVELYGCSLQPNIHESWDHRLNIAEKDAEIPNLAQFLPKREEELTKEVNIIMYIGGGLTPFLFSLPFGEDSHFDLLYIFQIGWNHLFNLFGTKMFWSSRSGIFSELFPILNGKTLTTGPFGRPKSPKTVFVKEVRGYLCWIWVLNFWGSLVYIISIYPSREQTSQREQLNFQDFPRITAWKERQKTGLWFCCWHSSWWASTTFTCWTAWSDLAFAEWFQHSKVGLHPHSVGDCHRKGNISCWHWKTWLQDVANKHVHIHIQHIHVFWKYTVCVFEIV